MDLKKLTHAVTLAKHRSYLLAAAELNLSPSALSRSIQALEEEFGLQMFDRGRGGVFLTDNGEQFVREAKILVSRAEDLKRSFKSIRAGSIGDIAFGLGPMIAATVLPELCRDIICEGRDFVIHVDVDARRSLLDRLVERDLEFVICAHGASIVRPELELEEVANPAFAIISGAHHPLVGQGALTRERLLAFPAIGGGLRRWESTDSFFGAEDFTLKLSCNAYELLPEVLESTDAVCFGTPPLLQRWQARYALIELPLVAGAFPASVPLVCATLKGRTLSYGAKVVRDRLCSALAGPPL